MPKVLQRDIEELESYYHSGDFVGYDCCLETLEATVRVESADKILDYYRASKGAFLCIQKNKRILHYGYIIKQSL